MSARAAAGPRHLAVTCLLLAAAVPPLHAASPAVHHDASLDAVAEARPADWLPVPVVQASGLFVAAAAEAGIRSSSAATRARAAFLLGDSGGAGYASALRPLLKDADVHVRMQAGIALCRLHDAAGLDAAEATLTQGKPWERYYAVVGLWTFGGRRATKALQKTDNGQGPLVALSIQSALAKPRTGVAKPVPKRSLPRPEGGMAGAVDVAANAFVGESDWWWHRGKYDQVIRANSVVTFLDPTSVEEYTNSAWLLWSMGRTSEAIGEYHRCIDNNPRTTHGYFYLGEYYALHKQPAQAEPYLAKAVALDPRDSISRRGYAHVLEELGKPAAALEQWDAILRANPRDAAARQNRKRVLSVLNGKTK